MSRGEGWKIALLLAITVFSLTYALRVFERDPQGPQPPNILIISICSFRYKLLTEYTGSSEVVMPSFEKFLAHSSFIFKNAFNGTPWTAFFSVAEGMMPVHEILDYGYTNHSNSSSDYILRVPHRESWGHPDDAPIDDSDFEKNHQEETDYIRSQAESGAHPFFMIAHYKYMHYPLIDHFNADADWDYYMTGEDRRKISEYLNHPEKYPEKLPFLLMLADDAKIPLSHPKIQKLGHLQDPWQQIKIKGLLTDPGLLADWQKSPGFQDDLVLLEKAYKGNARYLDKVVGPILDLWGNERLKKNTIVILTGDHGEMHMEHGVLTHGYSLYDEALKVPMAIRFPGVEHPVRIESQMHFRMLTQLVEGMVRGVVSAKNLEKTLAKVQEDAFLLRDCVNSKRGLRFKNQYKYIFDIAEDRPYLYDLQRDPNETTDVSATHPELVDQFEKQFWQLYPVYTTIDPGSCFSWAATREG